MSLHLRFFVWFILVQQRLCQQQPRHQPQLMAFETIGSRFCCSRQSVSLVHFFVAV
jgi:flagellar biogenesis protein FliO